MPQAPSETGVPTPLHLAPLKTQIALAVSTNGARPSIPGYFPSELSSLVARCCAADPGQRPTFPEIAAELRDIIAALQKRVRI